MTHSHKWLMFRGDVGDLSSHREKGPYPVRSDKSVSPCIRKKKKAERLLMSLAAISGKIKYSKPSH